MNVFTRRAVLAAPLLAAFAAEAEEKQTDTLILKTIHGETKIKLRPDLAPKTVAQIKALVQRKFYDGIVFHRVIPGFMAQTGDPTGTGSGGSDLPDIPAEFSGAHFGRGTLGMARASDPNSANSQFFICLGDAGFLDNKYTVFGEVVSGMKAIDEIKAGSEADNGKVDQPDKILSLRFAPDAK
ncbi:MAG: peptidylprolyl isomerase [Roseiarcus sp.]